VEREFRKFKVNGWAAAASVVDVAVHSSSDELSSPRRIEPAHFGCVEDD